MTNEKHILYEDKNNIITMVKDSYLGILFELCRKPNNCLVKSYTIKAIKIGCQVGDKYFKGECRGAIKELKDMVKGIENNDSMIEGVFQDYRSFNDEFIREK